MSSNPRPLPPPIGPGARVGVIALASSPPLPALRRGLGVLREAGLEVVTGRSSFGRGSYLAGSDEERLEDLSKALDANVEVLLVARGGYGVMRLLPHLPWERLAEWRGWVVGFSDATALHAALASRFPVATLHGPMVTSLARSQASTVRLLAWLRGEARREIFTIGRRQVVRGGQVRGVAVGGNLSILASLVGTPYEPDYEGAVLFLEDVGEPAYRLDRLLTQLRLSSRLTRVKAVIVGQLARCGRGGGAWRERWRRLLLEAVPEDAVVVTGLPFGHGARNFPFPLGTVVEVDTAQGTLQWGGC